MICPLCGQTGLIDGRFVANPDWGRVHDCLLGCLKCQDSLEHPTLASSKPLNLLTESNSNHPFADLPAPSVQLARVKSFPTEPILQRGKILQPTGYFSKPGCGPFTTNPKQRAKTASSEIQTGVPVEDSHAYNMDTKSRAITGSWKDYTTGRK